MVQSVKSGKRPVNLSLNADLVAQARDVTDNLSEVVELLLAGFIAEEKAKRADRLAAIKQMVTNWNSFGEQHGSFADEYSTL